jgi:hypothetical protein
MRFPFWLVTPIRAQVPAPLAECAKAWVPLTFSTEKRMTAYLSARAAGQWEVRLVNRYSAAAVVRELTARGCEAACYDVSPDGSGGTLVPLAEILAKDERDR